MPKWTELTRIIPGTKHIAFMLDVLRYLSIGVPVLLLLRLVQQRLWRLNPYSALAGFLLIGLARDLGLLKPGYTTHEYTVLWKATLPVLLLGQALAGFATYRAIGSLYPKIGRFAVWLFAACLIAALLAGLVFLPFEMRRIGAAEAELRMLFLVQRWLATTLAGGLALAVLFLWRYPAPLKKVPRNIRLHTACIAVYFASYAILYVLENLKQLGGAATAELVQLGVVVGVYAVWTGGLSRAGQASEAWPALDPAVDALIDTRYRAARQLMSQAAGEGRK